MFKKFVATGLPLVFLGVSASCGEFSNSSTSPSEKIHRGEERKEVSVETSGSGNVTKMDTALFNVDGSVKLPEGAVIPNIPPISCAKQKSKRDLVASVYQDMLNRTPSAEESAKADDPGFKYEDFVERMLSSTAIEDTISKFVTNYFKLGSITAGDKATAAEVQRANDLRLEPVVLIQKNKDKPWPWFWKTQDFYCTESTASLYGLSRPGSYNFVECKLPPERAGLLGLVSVLRAATGGTPTAFYMINNNYRRVRSLLKWTLGIDLQAATNGPSGSGEILPFADCVPTLDTRVQKNKDGSMGTIFGTAAVALSGSTCSGCHSKYNGPLSIAFRRFGPNGELLDFNSIDALKDNDLQGASKAFLKDILAEQNSCWNPDLSHPPKVFQGLTGLAQVISESNKFGEALGIQIPTALGNIKADENMSASIAKKYFEGGQTLKAAFSGFFLSDSYKCEVKN